MKNGVCLSNAFANYFKKEVDELPLLGGKQK